MMFNYKVTVQYDGTKYSGWQSQGNTQNTIQCKLETVLSRMLDKKTEIFGAGRTDAGVHAKAQVFNFKSEIKLDEDAFMADVNGFLPEDIAVIGIEEAPERFHARFNAKGKTYVYRLWTGDKPDVFLRKYVYAFPQSIDINKMRSAARLMIGKHDFLAFSSAKAGKKSTVREIYSIEIMEEGDEVRIILHGNGFLYNMARIISGTLAQIGCGAIDESSILKAFETGSRSFAGVTLPACGLVLEKVDY